MAETNTLSEIHNLTFEALSRKFLDWLENGKTDHTEDGTPYQRDLTAAECTVIQKHLAYLKVGAVAAQGTASGDLAAAARKHLPRLVRPLPPLDTETDDEATKVA